MFLKNKIFLWFKLWDEIDSKLPITSTITDFMLKRNLITEFNNVISTTLGLYHSSWRTLDHNAESIWCVKSFIVSIGHSIIA